jgi:hypothetical protein
MTLRGILNVLSMLYLALVVSLVFAINEHEDLKLIFRSTLRRWAKLTLALIAIGIIVAIWSNI